ncbi:hypothetical protein [Chromobacterium sp. ATCC 53434]|nr:hypothetical protein [Chromobacterium sp. ATCC 53434]
MSAQIKLLAPAVQEWEQEHLQAVHLARFLLSLVALRLALILEEWQAL